MPETTASGHLRDALDFMTSTNWVKGCPARAADGEPVVPNDPDAIEYCTLGYLDRVSYWLRDAQQMAAQSRAVAFLVAAIPHAALGSHSDQARLARYNDANDTTFEDIVLLFKRAYEAALDAGD